MSQKDEWLPAYKAAATEALRKEIAEGTAREGTSSEILQNVLKEGSKKWADRPKNKKTENRNQNRTGSGIV